MKDSPKIGPVNSTGAAAKPKAVRDPTCHTVSRCKYISMRLEEIAAEVDEIITRREKLHADLQFEPGKSVPSLAEVRQRRAYLTERLAIIRIERAELNAEIASIAIRR